VVPDAEDLATRRMGSTGRAGLAREVGISAVTLKRFLEDSMAYGKTVERIATYLGARAWMAGTRESQARLQAALRKAEAELEAAIGRSAVNAAAKKVMRAKEALKASQSAPISAVGAGSPRREAHRERPASGPRLAVSWLREAGGLRAARSFSSAGRPSRRRS
jgi:hypothetical protein